MYPTLFPASNTWSVDRSLTFVYPHTILTPNILSNTVECKGGEQVAKVGGGGGGGSDLYLCTVTTVGLWAYAHSPPREVWGHAPPENFGNFNSLRAFLM